MLVVACGPSHRYGRAPDKQDTRHLFVEIAADGRRDDALRAGAESGLANVAFARPVDSGGDVELQVEVSSLDTAGNETMCGVKILVLRLPTHDLLGIADGSAHTRGTNNRAGDDCVENLGANLVRGKVRVLLRKRLDAKK